MRIDDNTTQQNKLTTTTHDHLAVNWHTNIVNKKYFPQNDDVIFFLMFTIH